MGVCKRLAILSLCLGSHLANAETIVMKDGSVIRGSIATMDEQVVTVDTADMGRLTIKRRNIQSIRDGVDTLPATTQDAIQSGASTQVNVNINNNQTNDQKLDTEQTQAAGQAGVLERSEPKAEAQPRKWQSGVFGRFGLTMMRVGFSGAPPDHGELNTDSDALGLAWDLIGYRSGSIWSVVLTANSGTLTKGMKSSNLERSIGGGGVRFDFNFLRTSHGPESVSQWFIGPFVGIQQYTIRDKVRRGDPDLGEKDFLMKVSGAQYAVQGGYEYLVSARNGVSVLASYNEAKLSEYEFADNSANYGFNRPAFSGQSIKTKGSAIALAWTYNFE